MTLLPLDWVIVLVTILICFVPALFFGKRAGKNTSEFFASGRSVQISSMGLRTTATSSAPRVASASLAFFTQSRV